MKMQPYVQQIRSTGPKITYVNVNNLMATRSIMCSGKKARAKVNRKQRVAALIA